MITIIQISDFHIKPSIGEPESNPVFSSLLDTLVKIKQENDGNHRKFILVFNGDVIDHQYIYDQILAGDYPTEEIKAAFWDKAAKEEYILAEKYFRCLMTTLGINSNEMILCCGNHDVNCFCKNPEEKIDCDLHNLTYSPKRFERYNAFLDNLGIPADQRSDTFFVTIHGINFLVANSNWLNKFEYDHRLCIDCSSIKSKICNNKELLKSNTKKRNVFVAHAPFSDYCEDAVGRFHANNYFPVMNDINQFFGLKLFGDKHTYYNADGLVITGAPLDDHRISCFIHDFEDEQEYYYRTLVYDEQAKWKIENFEQYIQNILTISEPFIKRQAKEYVFGNMSTITPEEMNKFDSIRSTKKWNNLDKLFLSCSKINLPRDGQSGELIPIDSDYIDALSDLIISSDQRVSLSIRGRVRLGKSVCMSVLYLNLLYRFACSQFDYIPIYINVEKIRQKHDDITNRDSSEYLNSVVNDVSTVLQRGQEQCRKYGRKACCILDGINQYSYYENAPIDDTIWSLFSDDKNTCYERIVFCSDIGNEKLRHTELHIKREAKFLVYFDPILTYSFHKKERFEHFIEAYCGLKGIADAELKKTTETIKNNVQKMKIPELSTSIMDDLWDILCNKNYNDTYFHALSIVTNKKITKNLKQITKACFLSYSKKMGYSEIKSRCKIDNKSFDTIRNQPHIANYLQAKYYVENISSRISDKDSDYYPNQLLDHEISSLVRDYIHDKNAEADILKYAEKNYQHLGSTGRATLSFLMGRFSSDKEVIIQLLEQQEDILKKAEEEKRRRGEHVDKYDRIARRSILLSRISMMPDEEKKQALLKYVHELISDENARKVNRCFYLQFYGDRRIDSTSEEDDMIHEGFDLFKTYQILVQRLKNQLEKQDEKWLCALELFTICDLLQIRLDNPQAHTEKKIVKSFFYNTDKYNMPKDCLARDVAKTVQELIDTYLGQYGEKDQIMFLEYLRHQSALYEKYVPLLEEGPLKESDMFAPDSFLEELIQLEKTKRMGWLFPENIIEHVDENEFQTRKNSSDCFETTLDHSYEMFLIGLLYLPQTSDSKEYDKRKILDIVLIHDLGESNIGDSIPAYIYYKRDKKNEAKWCRNLYMQGVHEGIADLTYYWELWKEWCNSNPNYNVKVAKDLDKLQMVYKLMRLLVKLDKQPAPYFCQARILQFWGAKDEIETKEVKDIFNIIIAGNKKFEDIANKNKLPHFMKLRSII